MKRLSGVKCLSWATLAVLVGEEEGVEEEAAVEGLELQKEKPYISRLNLNLCTSIQQTSKDIHNKRMSIDNGSEPKELSKENIAAHEESTQSLRNIDLNANLRVNEEKNNTSMDIPTHAPLPEPAATTDMQHEEIPGYSFLMSTR
ncbi:hypothetical protein MtrunA17_Chr5g0420401 [Medicago truncatula]|nr:hypothetical protein MtrunA17_Chr5g0420401 [Medicago truncatula]